MKSGVHFSYTPYAHALIFCVTSAVGDKMPERGRAGVSLDEAK